MSQRSRARHDSHPDENAGATGAKRSTPTPRGMPQRRNRRPMHDRGLLNALTCSWRFELLSWLILRKRFLQATYEALQPTAGPVQSPARILATGSANSHSQFQKRSQLLIRTHNETLSVAMRVRNPDCSCNRHGSIRFSFRCATSKHSLG